MPVQVMVSGAVHNTLAYAIVGGAAHFVPQIYVNVGGVIHALYSYYWAVGGWGGCSAACGGGVQYRSVVCTRNDGVTLGDEVCSKLGGGKPVGSQGCNTQSCITCRYDDANRTQFTPGDGHFVRPSCALIVNGTSICVMPGACVNVSCNGWYVGTLVSGGLGGVLYQICGPF